MEIISIIALGLLVWLGTRILVNTLVKGNKADDIIGSTVKVNMSDRDKIFNRFNNADCVEAVDMSCYELKANDELHNMQRRINDNETEAEKVEREYMQRKKDEHIKAFGGYFEGNKFVSVREEAE